MSVTAEKRAFPPNSPRDQRNVNSVESSGEHEQRMRGHAPRAPVREEAAHGALCLEWCQFRYKNSPSRGRSRGYPSCYGTERSESPSVHTRSTLGIASSEFQTPPPGARRSKPKPLICLVLLRLRRIVASGVTRTSNFQRSPSRQQVSA